MKRIFHRSSQFIAACGVALAIPCLGAIDIADQPLINTTTVTKPNLLFVLDDSGSMARDYMPDDASDTGKYMYWSYQCNGLQYNPSTSYPLPVTSTGASYPAMGFAAAWSDGFKPSFSTSTTSSSSLNMGVTSPGTSKTVVVSSASGYSTGNTVVLADSSNYYRWMLGTVTATSGTSITVNFTFSTDSSAVTKASWVFGKPSGSTLNNKYYYTYKGTAPLLGWTYTSTGPIQSGPFFDQCNTAVGSDTANFTKVTITTSSTDTQNYANWYSYYRKRYLMARSAGGRAMSGLNSNFRVGFTIISDETSAVAGTNNFVDVLDFTDSQKLDFYSNLYQVEPGGYTPLRTALNKAGKYYANKMSGQRDPMQYACQRNYTLLTTDGYWNDTSTSFTQLDGSTNIANQDGMDARPQWDGTVYTSTKTDSTVRTLTYTNNETWTTPYAKKYTFSSCTRISRNNYSCSGTVKTGTFTNTQTVKAVSTTTITTSTVTTTTTTAGVPTTTTSSPTSSTSTTGPTNTILTSTFADTTVTSSAAGTYTCNPCSSPSSPQYTTPGTTTTTTTSSSSTDTTSPPPSTTTNSTSGGASDTLADIAEYYYKNDIRTSDLGNCTSGSSGYDVCNNEVPTSGRDTQQAQHMTSFTLGFGVNGILPYDQNYLTQTSGSYVDLINGTQTWPVPSADKPTTADDLWHAAVNGRGQYFSASNPTVLAASLATVINTISQVNGAGAAAAASSLKPVPGEGQTFVGSYTTLEWTGDLAAQTININTSTNSVYFTDAWSAKAQLAGRAYTTRNIYYKGTGGTAGSGLAPFDYTHLSTDSLASNFDSFCSKPTTPSQCSTLNATQITSASGTNLVNFLRGDQTNEAASTGPLYRTRVSVLGDIVGSGPVYVGTPAFKYTDTGYSDFVTAQASRRKMVYVAANDGMLHAFSANSAVDGAELWAYIPTMAMPNMYRLADTAYSTGHRFILDGTPVSGDIRVGTTWKTILVGGMGVGGSGYYALDVTDPANPKSLWEFTDADMGKSFGNPIITKLVDGTWVVVFTSGFNNTGPGYLYVVNANTGAQIYKIPTRDSTSALVGTAANPANLGEINAWVDNVTDNTAKRIYGGDMLGNLWRFDISSLVQPYLGSLQLAKFQTSSGSPAVYSPQAISTRPELASIKYGASRYPVVLIGTGRYLGSSDITTTQQQTLYAIKDPLTNTGWGDVRTNPALFSQTITASTTVATSTTNTLDWSTKIGWKYDFAQSRERLNTDMTLQYTTLVLSTTIPESTVCTPAGSSWDYSINIVDGSIDTAVRAGNYMTVGVNTIAMTIDGETRLFTLRRKHTGETVAGNGATPPKDSARRTSWRELLD